MAIAAVAQLAEELVDEVAAVGEDEDAAGARGLDEAHRGDGLAGAGGVLEPEALVGVGVVGGALLDVLVDVGLGVVLPGVLGLAPASSSSSSSSASSSSSSGSSVLVLVVLVGVELGLVVVLVLVVGLVRGGNRGGGLRLGLVVDREHRLGGRRGHTLAVLDGGQQRGQRAGERIDLVGVEQRAVGQARLVVAEHPLEPEQQRVAPAPSRRGHLGAGVDLAQRVLQRTPPGGARAERDGGVFAVVNEALTCERLGALDGGLIGNRCGLNGHRHGISQSLAICLKRRVAAYGMPGDSEPPGLPGDEHGRDCPGLVRPSP